MIKPNAIAIKTNFVNEKITLQYINLSYITLSRDLITSNLNEERLLPVDSFPRCGASLSRG